MKSNVVSLVAYSVCVILALADEKYLAAWAFMCALVSQFELWLVRKGALK